ncbi:MAG: hypothetical protein A2W99_03835 [Bacteroidetes bacterium GWF2_33_16]|nr:MAG: hypothetical protein A2X00_12245 [Bacteroidetes bacterium GWE2_32_14]OFY03624.1 MAG: hypothetical protein A2W99_03835 [Bacteroidetes bacterium GWF2_33_16]
MKQTCRLCKKNEANQTGSHITSAFLLASQIGKRGNEKSFLISTDPKQNYLEDRKDKDVKEDYILCSDCEKRLSFIENIFSAEITNKIEVEKYSQNYISVAAETGIYLNCNKINPIAFHLFFYSVILRISISTQSLYNHFNLEAELEDELSFLLDLFLPVVINHKVAQSVDNWEKMVEYCQDLFSFFPYIVLKSRNQSNKTGNYQWYDNVSKEPYHLMLNEYIILPFFNSLVYEDDFFQLKDHISYVDFLNNSYDCVKLGILENELYESIIVDLQDQATSARLKEIRKEVIGNLIANNIPIDRATVDALVEMEVNKLNM